MINKASKKAVAAVTALMVSAAAAVTVYAYLGGKDSKTNTMFVAEGTASIAETFSEPERQTDLPTDHNKVVRVTNTGAAECFVRVYAEFSDSRMTETAYDPENSGSTKPRSEVSENGTSFLAWDALKQAHMTDGSGSKWRYVDSTDALGGYFYYTEKLQPNASTDPLISKLRTDFENYYDISDFDLIVYSETVQTTEIDESGTVYTDDQWETAWRSFLQVGDEPVTVTPSITIGNAPTQTLFAGETLYPLTASFSPDDGTARTVTWSSSNNDTATVDANGNLKAVDTGTAVITASSDGCTPATVTVNVINTAHSYKDENGSWTDIRTMSPEPLTDSIPTSLTEGTYLVTGNAAASGRVNISGEVKLILAQGSHFNAEGHGICVAAGTTLKIYALGDESISNPGRLTATATGSEENELGASGIGSNAHKKEEGTGDIVICGGKIEAQGINGGAGIGGGHNSNGGKITITGGKVTATGGVCGSNGAGAGIGGGYSASNGTITIKGGTVKATGNIMGGNGSAAIGGGARGDYGGDAGTITIIGGFIEAEAPSGIPALGRSNSSASAGTITISDGLNVYNGIGNGKTPIENGNTAVGNNPSYNKITILKD